MIRVLTPIGIALFFISYPPFHRLLRFKSRSCFEAVDISRSFSSAVLVSRSVEKFSPATTRSWRPCHGAVAVLFAHESQAKRKSATRVVTGSLRQTSHARGMETAFTRRDLRRASAISNSLDLLLVA